MAENKLFQRADYEALTEVRNGTHVCTVCKKKASAAVGDFKKHMRHRHKVELDTHMRKKDVSRLYVSLIIERFSAYHYFSEQQRANVIFAARSSRGKLKAPVVECAPSADLKTASSDWRQQSKTSIECLQPVSFLKPTYNAFPRNPQLWSEMDRVIEKALETPTFRAPKSATQK